MESEKQFILKHKQNGVLRLIIDRPKVNALNFQILAELKSAFNQAAQDESIRCVLISGAGEVFSAGHDVLDIANAQGESYRDHLKRTYNPLILQMRSLQKPIIAAINGAVSGAALGIVLACDLRVAATNAQITVGFTRLGLGLDSAVSLLLPAMIGLGRATEYTFTNTPINAADALALGLVNRVVPPADLADEAFHLAANLAAGPVHAIGLCKEAFNRAVLRDLSEILENEAQLQEIASRTVEHQEGVRAFLEKRPARFSA